MRKWLSRIFLTCMSLDCLVSLAVRAKSLAAEEKECNPQGLLAKIIDFRGQKVSFMDDHGGGQVSLAEVNSPECLKAGARVSPAEADKMQTLASSGADVFLMVRVYKQKESPLCLVGVDSDEDRLAKKWRLYAENQKGACFEEPYNLTKLVSLDGRSIVFVKAQTAKTMLARSPGPESAQAPSNARKP